MGFKKRHIVLATAIVLAVLIDQFPANLAKNMLAPKSPVTLGGTIWDGYVPSLNALPPISFKTSLVGLFTDAPLAEFSGNGNGLSILATAERDMIKRLELTGDARFIGQIDGRMANLLGRFDVTAANVRFDGTCGEPSSAQVSGNVSTDILTKNTALWQWSGPPLSGPISCDNGVLTASLLGNIPGQSVEAVLKVLPDGTYQIRAVINTRTPQAGLILPLYGFEAKGERYTMNESGRWM